MKIVFMGTPDFAVESLIAIHEAGHEILLVVSQEDKAKGRKGIIEKTPVKKAAESLGIPVLSTKRLREDRDCIERIRSLAPDCIVVTAFGQILPKEVLNIPRIAPAIEVRPRFSRQFAWGIRKAVLRRCLWQRG